MCIRDSCNTHPKANEPHVKDVDGDEWKYCDHHKKWGRHSSEECNARQGQRNRDEPPADIDGRLAAIDEYDSDSPSGDEQE